MTLQLKVKGEVILKSYPDNLLFLSIVVLRYMPNLISTISLQKLKYSIIITAGVKQNSKESTGPEKCSTGPKYRNGRNKIC